MESAQQSAAYKMVNSSPNGKAVATKQTAGFRLLNVDFDTWFHSLSGV